MMRLVYDDRVIRLNKPSPINRIIMTKDEGVVKIVKTKNEGWGRLLGVKDAENERKQMMSVSSKHDMSYNKKMS